MTWSTSRNQLQSVGLPKTRNLHVVGAYRDAMLLCAGSADSGEAIDPGADAPPEEEFPTEDLVLEGAVDDGGEGADGEEVCQGLGFRFVARLTVGFASE